MQGILRADRSDVSSSAGARQRQDPPPGVLAYEGDDVVGWAAVHPRVLMRRELR